MDEASPGDETWTETEIHIALVNAIVIVTSYLLLSSLFLILLA